MKFFGNPKLALLAVVSLVFLAVGGATNALAVVQYEQNVTPEVIFGAGNLNGSFTTDRRNGVEIGLRGKLRFDNLGNPQNIFNSNSNGTYNFQAIVGPTQSSPTPEWSFEWSVNTNFDGSSGNPALNDLTYEMGLDGDPGPGTDFLIFDPITPNPPLVPFFDHSIGINTTGNGAGIEAGDEAGYLTLLDENNVAQNSQRYDFFPFGPLASFDPTVDGTYAIYLLARNGDGEVIARVDIQILVGNGQPVEGSALDHFQCYDIDHVTKLNPRPEVSLNDQFGFRDNVRVKKRARSYCTPVDKNGEGIVNPDITLTCYKIKKGKKEKLDIVVDNQFGEQEFRLKKPKLLCVPTRQLSPTSDGDDGGSGDGGTPPPDDAPPNDIPDDAPPDDDGEVGGGDGDI